MRTLFSKSQNQTSPMASTTQPIVSTQLPTMTVARLISKREWLHLVNILSDEKQRIPIDEPNIPHPVTEDIVIHFAVRFQAPLQIVSFLANLYPQSLEQSDATGRFPVHVASKWGAAPDVIHFLIRSNPVAAGIQDDLGKTPMHYVAEFYAKNYNRRNILPVNESMLQVVQLLKTAAPKSVNLEDHEGVNAIEYALESNTDLKVIRSMQRACRDDWREMKKQNQGKKHEDLVKDVERIALELQRQMSERRGLGTDAQEEKTLDAPLHFHVHRSTTEANTRAARTA